MSALPAKTFPPELPPRRHFEGASEILAYNWPAYALGSVTALLTPLLAAQSTAHLPWPDSINKALHRAANTGAILAGFWTLGSLVASYLAYDRSPLYAWKWLPPLFPAPPRTILNLHAGLDQCGSALRHLFPAAELTTLDIFDDLEMGEPSIRRARKLAHNAISALPARFDGLPVADASQDAIFVMFTAHELRSKTARESFFDELSRVLAPDGRLLIVEHVRDAANFAAFGPGFWHFLPVGEWERLGRDRFQPERAFRITPFLRVWTWRKVEETGHECSGR